MPMRIKKRDRSKKSSSEFGARPVTAVRARPPQIHRQIIIRLQKGSRSAKPRNCTWRALALHTCMRTRTTPSTFISAIIPLMAGQIAKPVSGRAISSANLLFVFFFSLPSLDKTTYWLTGGLHNTPRAACFNSGSLWASAAFVIKMLLVASWGQSDTFFFPFFLDEMQNLVAF